MSLSQLLELMLKAFIPQILSTPSIRLSARQPWYSIRLSARHPLYCIRIIRVIRGTQFAYPRN
jgi:hypothetical protein